VHNRQKDGGYALTHSLYYYDGNQPGGRIFDVCQPPIPYQEAPIAMRSSA